MSLVRKTKPSIRHTIVDPRLLYGLLFVALLMRFARGGTANASYLVLAAYALFGRAQAIQALALSWLFTMLSAGVAPEASGATVGRYAVLGAAVAATIGRAAPAKGVFSISRPVLATLALGAFIVFHSILFSDVPDVSIFKAVSWTLAMASLLSAWKGLSSLERARLERQLFGGLAALLLVSVPFAFSGIGYLRNGTGFQGILNHPQALGPTAALLGAWASGRLLGLSRPRALDGALLGLCLTLVVMSQSRAAGLALAMGVASAVLLLPVVTRTPLPRLMPGLASRWALVAVVAAAIALVFVGPVLGQRLGSYIQKGSDSPSWFEIADQSRGELVDKMVANIKEEPLTGIGFGVASDPSSMVTVRDSVLGLPVSAVSEKGVLPLAVPEELGILGLLLVIIWLCPMIMRGARSGVAAFAVLATVLFTNLGESTFFSPGGMGLLYLVFFAWAVTGSHNNVRGSKRG